MKRTIMVAIVVMALFRGDHASLIRPPITGCPGWMPSNVAWIAPSGHSVTFLVLQGDESIYDVLPSYGTGMRNDMTMVDGNPIFFSYLPVSENGLYHAAVQNDDQSLVLLIITNATVSELRDAIGWFFEGHCIISSPS